MPLVVALALTGACSDGGSGVPSSTEATRVVVHTPTPDPSLPTATDATTERGDEALPTSRVPLPEHLVSPTGGETANDDATDFMRWFIELYPYVFNTGDTEAFAAHSHPDCGYCASVLEGVSEDAAAGVGHRHGPVVVTSGSAQDWFLDEGNHYVQLTMVQEPSDDIGPDGVVTGSASRRLYTLAARVSRTSGQWQVLGVSIDPVQDLPEEGWPSATALPTDLAPEPEATVGGGTTATARYALLYTYASATGDTAPLVDASEPDCSGCNDLVSRVAAVPDASRPRDATVLVERTSCTSLEPQPAVDCNVTIRLDRPGRGSSWSTLYLRGLWTGERWVVRAMSVGAVPGISGRVYVGPPVPRRDGRVPVAA